LGKAMRDHLDHMGDGFLVVVTGNADQNIRAADFLDALGRVGSQCRIVHECLLEDGSCRFLFQTGYSEAMPAIFRAIGVERPDAPESIGTLSGCSAFRQLR
jgi:hypothetical protein